MNASFGLKSSRFKTLYITKSRKQLLHLKRFIHENNISSSKQKLAYIEEVNNDKVKSFRTREDSQLPPLLVDVKSQDDFVTRLNKIASSIIGVFLPSGYPHSVTPDYIHYYKWIFVLSITGSATYVMSMTALLHSVNLASSAAGIAAGVNWVLKDGLGSIGKILSANILASRFDTDTKRAMWWAEVFYNTGTALEMLTSMFPMLFLFLGTIANVIKGVAGLTVGACRASINKQFARQENLGDITARTTTQGLVGYIIGTSVGIGLHTIFSGGSYLWGVFGCLACLHLFSSYRALRNIRFVHLNQQRAALLMEQYFKGEVVDTPTQMQEKQKETIIFPPSFLRNPSIVLGSSIHNAFPTQQQLMDTLLNFHNEQYILSHDSTNTIHVVLKEGISSTDMLKSFFCAYYYRHCLLNGQQVSIQQAVEYTNQSMDNFVQLITEKEWSLSSLVLAPSSIRVRWSFEN
eukprot:TRINITY_DN10334_c0_g1_i1.p1 TRINITY_DN10334_c0_g1~~TRINITY_DN10334_c0_g1_i1.p1  ORF type:complete len:462 (-),score=80.11 TRINITY_DN10334_c0_g1_i1:66-1451(-)